MASAESAAGASVPSISIVLDASDPTPCDKDVSLSSSRRHIIEALGITELREQMQCAVEVLNESGFVSLTGHTRVGDLIRSDSSSEVLIRVKSRAGSVPQLPADPAPWLSVVHDGFNAADPTIHPREAKCARVHQDLLTQRVRLWRSPPGSGKTSLTRLLRTHAPPGVAVKTLSLLPLVIRGISIEQLWLETFNESLGDSLDPHRGPPRTYIIDEAQLAYAVPGAADQPFWRALKLILSTPPTDSGVSVLLMAAYGVSPSVSWSSSLGPPFAIPDAWSLTDLSLDPVEAMELVARFNVTSREHNCPPMSPTLWGTVLHMTGRHIGITRAAFWGYHSWCRDWRGAISGELLDAKAEARFVAETLLHLGTWPGSVRSLPSLAALDAATFDFVVRVAAAGTAGLTLSASEAAATIPTALITSGVFTLSEKESAEGVDCTLRFSSPLMLNHALNFIYGRQPKTLVWRDGTPLLSASALAREIVKRMDRATLTETGSTAAGEHLLERQHQMAFFSAAVSCLPPGITVSPDYGRVHDDSPGYRYRYRYVDFYIHSPLSIGIELTREGKGLSSHSRRFAEGGVHSPLPLRGWVVVDFSRAPPPPQVVADHPNTLFVVFPPEDFSTVTLVQHGQPQEVV